MDKGRRVGDGEPVKRFNEAYRAIDVKFDPRRPHEIIIEGIRYSTFLFEQLGNGPMGMPEGELFRLESRADDCITLTRISHAGAILQAQAMFNQEVFDAAVRIETARLRRLTAWQRLKGRLFPTKER